MRPRQYVSPTQAGSLIFMAFNGIGLYLFMHSYSIAGRAGWVATIAGMLAIIPLAWWLLYLSSRYPGMTILEIIEITVGKTISRLINVVFIILTIVLAACVLNFFASLMQTFFLPHTPPWFVMLVITSVTVLIARDGIEVLGRFVFLLAVFSVLIYFPVTASGAGLFRIENLTPIFVVSPLRFAKGTFWEMGFHAEGLLFLMTMAAVLPKPQKYYKAITIGALSLVSARSLGGAMMIMLLGAERMAFLPFPSFSAVQSIQAFGFLYGLEVLILISFQMLMFSKVPLHFWSSWVAVTQIFNNRKPEVFWWVLFTAITGTAIGMNSYNTAYAAASFVAKYALLPFVALVLVVASVGCWVKRGRGKINRIP